jgi:hypothetical protein
MSGTFRWGFNRPTTTCARVKAVMRSAFTMLSVFGIAACAPLTVQTKAPFRVDSRMDVTTAPIDARVQIIAEPKPAVSAPNAIVLAREGVEERTLILADNRSGYIWRALIALESGDALIQVAQPADRPLAGSNCIEPKGIRLVRPGQFAIIAVDAGCEIRGRALSGAGTLSISIISTIDKIVSGQ